MCGLRNKLIRHAIQISNQSVETTWLWFHRYWLIPEFVWIPRVHLPPRNDRPEKEKKTTKQRPVQRPSTALQRYPKFLWSPRPQRKRRYQREVGNKTQQNSSCTMEGLSLITTRLSTTNNHIISMINHHSSYVFINYEHQLSIMNHQVLHPTIKNDSVNQKKLRFSDSLPDLVTKQSWVIEPPKTTNTRKQWQGPKEWL